MVSPDTLPAAFEILADLRGHRGRAAGGLPTSELANFGFELLIGRALAQGWGEVFVTSDAEAAYAAKAAPWAGRDRHVGPCHADHRASG